MTKARKAMLDATVRTFGHEHPFTIEIFKISERLPEQEFDCVILIMFNARQTEYFNEPDYDEMAQEYEEQEVTDLGFNPYLGCYDFDC